jgi:hypothetical protein
MVFVSAALFLFALAKAQEDSVFFCERFDTCSGTHVPDGWHNVDLIKGAYYNLAASDLWRCDNPGDQVVNEPISAPFAIFDSDATSSSDNSPENSALASPVFDTRGVDFDHSAIVLDFDQYFVGGYEAKIYVEVWNGDDWHAVYKETSTTFNPDHQVIDITHHVRGNHGRGLESRVRFRWTGDASWFWAVDNVRVSIVDLMVSPNSCPSHRPHKCHSNGECVADKDECLNGHNCPADRPVRCLDGSCVRKGTKKDGSSHCPEGVECPMDAPVRCADGSCVEALSQCTTLSNCPISAPQRCNDGSCAATASDCPLTIACPDEFAPYPCRGGSCASSPEMCPKVKATDLVCHCDQVQCPDLSCADSIAECTCPCEYPYLCIESRTCVQEAIFCKGTALPTPSAVAEKVGNAGHMRHVRVEECPEGTFRCFDGQCVSSLATCPNLPCSSFESADGAELAFKCPDGSCARRREECPVIASCGGRGTTRCGDGTCAAAGDECPEVEECTFGRRRCADGRCYANGECPPYEGCPVELPYTCPSGRCALNMAQCFTGCGPHEHKCGEALECQPWSEDCPADTTVSRHRAVPFCGSLNCIAAREDSLFYDVVVVADRFFEDLFATIMVPAGIFGRAPADAKLTAFDVPTSEVRPLPPYPDTISHVLGINIPEAVFEDGDFVRLTLRVDLPGGKNVDDYCLAQLVEHDSGEHEWTCVDSNLVADGVHFSGLVQSADGSLGAKGCGDELAAAFAIIKKPGVCNKYRGFDDSLVEFVMLGRTIPKTIRRLQTLHDRLSSIRDRMPEIKQSNAVLTYIAKATYFFTEECMSQEWQQQLATFPAQLGYSEPASIAASDDTQNAIGDGEGDATDGSN